MRGPTDDFTERERRCVTGMAERLELATRASFPKFLSGNAPELRAMCLAGFLALAEEAEDLLFEIRCARYAEALRKSRPK